MTTVFDPQRFVRQMTGMETCILCHGSYNLLVSRSDSPRHSLWVDSTMFLESVHARLGCTACHTNIDEHGHRLKEMEPVEKACAPCHVQPGPLGKPVLSITVEGKSIEDDPGRAHAVARKACLNCHPNEAAEYRQSVHGVAVMDKQIIEAPFCTDCHGVHYILPRTDSRALTYPGNVPSTCLRCHDQANVKARAGLSKNIGESYGQSFHGKRSELGNIDVAVCSTCHGWHGIYAPSDPRSQVNRARIAKTCGQCHDGAQLSFATAFTHQSVSETEQLGLYILKQVYIWVIFLMISLFIVLVILDMIQHYRHRRTAAHG